MQVEQVVAAGNVEEAAEEVVVVPSYQLEPHPTRTAYYHPTQQSSGSQNAGTARAAKVSSTAASAEPLVLSGHPPWTPAQTLGVSTRMRLPHQSPQLPQLEQLPLLPAGHHLLHPALPPLQESSANSRLRQVAVDLASRVGFYTATVAAVAIRVDPHLRLDRPAREHPTSVYISNEIIVNMENPASIHTTLKRVV